MANITNIEQTPELTKVEKDSRRELFGTIVPGEVPQPIIDRRQTAVEDRSAKRKLARSTITAIAGIAATGALIGSQADSEYQHRAPEPTPKVLIQPPVAP